MRRPRKSYTPAEKVATLRRFLETSCRPRHFHFNRPSPGITPLLQQAHTAQNALTRAVEPEPKTEKVRFYLTDTKACVWQPVRALVLICQSSLPRRGQTAA
jgi:hypothetical protein